MVRLKTDNLRTEIYNVSNIGFVPDLSDQKKKSGRHMLDRYLLWITLYLSSSVA